MKSGRTYSALRNSRHSTTSSASRSRRSADHLQHGWLIRNQFNLRLFKHNFLILWHISKLNLQPSAGLEIVILNFCSMTDRAKFAELFSHTALGKGGDLLLFGPAANVFIDAHVSINKSSKSSASVGEIRCRRSTERGLNESAMLYGFELLLFTRF